MYSARYGIWGLDPYGPDVMAKALQTSAGLGANQTHALQNEALGLQNKYIPQNEAIKLAGAVLGQENLAHQQQRFGPGYVLGRMLNTLPSEVKLGLAAKNPELYSSAVQMANQDYINGGSSNNSGIGMNILQPFINKQIGSNVNLQPAPPESQNYSMGNYSVPQNNNSSNPASSSQQFVAPDSQNKNSSITNTVRESGKQGYENKIRTADQKKRIDAGARFTIAVKNLNEMIPLVIDRYTGVFGKLNLQKDRAAALLNASNITPEYKAYIDMQNPSKISEGDLGVALGKRSTDNAQKEVSEIMKFDNFFSNPKLAISRWQNSMGVLEQTIENNKLTTADQVSQPKVSLKIPEEKLSGMKSSQKKTESKSGWGNDSKSYTHSNGKSYTLEELQKIARGGK